MSRRWGQLTVAAAVLALICAGVLAAVRVGDESGGAGPRVALLSTDTRPGADVESALGRASAIPPVEPAQNAPATTTTASTAPSAVRAAGTTTTALPAPSPAEASGLPPTPFPVNPSTGNPATIQPYAPGAWRLTHNGITLEARVEPPSPNVGDTVRFTFSASGTGDYCCDLFLYIGNEQRPIYQSCPPPGPCPLPQSVSGQATYVASERGPVGFHLNANLAASLCSPPPQFASTNLFAGFVVQPW